jgi:hypothetical protein
MEHHDANSESYILRAEPEKRHVKPINYESKDEKYVLCILVNRIDINDDYYHRETPHGKRHIDPRQGHETTTERLVLFQCHFLWC